VATVVGGAGLTLVLGSVAAEAAPRVQVSSTSLVLADGAAVAVPLKVSCDPGTIPNVSVEISQRSGRQIANSFGNETDVICDGTPRVVQVFVQARMLAFFPGVAFVTANIFSCQAFPFPGSAPFPFPPSTSACSAKSSRTTRLVPGILQESSQL